MGFMFFGASLVFELCADCPCSVAESQGPDPNSTGSNPSKMEWRTNIVIRASKFHEEIFEKGFNPIKDVVGRCQMRQTKLHAGLPRNGQNIRCFNDVYWVVHPFRYKEKKTERLFGLMGNHSCNHNVQTIQLRRDQGIPMRERFSLRAKEVWCNLKDFYKIIQPGLSQKPLEPLAEKNSIACPARHCNGVW